MTTSTPTSTDREQPVRHRDWMTLATEEYRRLDALLAQLSDEDWTLPTDCDEWNVRELVAHLAGAAEAGASMRHLAHQARLGRRLRPGEPGVDGMNAVQVQERADVEPARLRAELATTGARAVRRRSGLPAALRALRVPFGPPLGTKPLGYLMDCIYTRDAWMHRIDISRATGRALRLTPEHDGRIVADVAVEWARGHGRPYRLTLTGPAGGSWSHGDGETLTLDAVEFCRIVSGRAPGTGLLAHPVPF
jgi:uncharacterized protein (TIGR03083 family)